MSGEVVRYYMRWNPINGVTYMAEADGTAATLYVLATDHATLQAKLDAVTKDAERYRWLRDMANDISESAPMVVRCDHTFDVSWRDALYGNALDAAIDEAAALTDQGRAGEGESW